MVNEVADNRFHSSVWNTWVRAEMAAPKTYDVPLSGAQGRMRTA